MKLNEFITQVLIDINSGLKDASAQTSKDYFVQTDKNAGVDFDIAVTTISSSTSQVEGKTKVGFVEVIGAGVGGKMDAKSENSEVSRIKFTVFIPY